ncbi:MAG: DUF6883 domain-containing protein [Salinibacter sp.]
MVPTGNSFATTLPIRAKVSERFLRWAADRASYARKRSSCISSRIGMEHADGSVVRTEETRHGTTYVVEGPLSGAVVRSVWMIRTGESFPRLVTAYPIE